MKSCGLWAFVGQGDGRKARVDLTGDEGEMGDRQPCLAECKEQASNVPRRDSRTPSPKPAAPGASKARQGKAFVRSCVVALCRPFLCVCVCAGAHRDHERLGFGLTGWPVLGLDGPCRDDANGFTATAALGRRGAHPQRGFPPACCWSCVTPGSHLPFFLMKWNPGTNGPRAQGKDTLRGKVQSSGLACVVACGWPSTLHTVQLAPLDARPHGSAEFVTACSSSLYSTVLWPKCVRSSLRNPASPPCQAQTCPRFGICPDITGSSFIPILAASLAPTGHTAPRIHFRLDCHGSRKIILVQQ